MKDKADTTKADKNTEEWYTPPKYADMVRRVFGGEIHFDPASCDKANEYVKACQYCTKEENGLLQHWVQGNTFLNPPYKVMMPWAEKLWDFNRWITEPVILLANSCTDTDWFHLLLGQNPQVCFVKQRIRFLDQDGQEQATGKKPNVFMFFSAKNNAQKGLFIDEFSQIGRVVGF